MTSVLLERILEPLIDHFSSRAICTLKDQHLGMACQVHWDNEAGEVHPPPKTSGFLIDLYVGLGKFKTGVWPRTVPVVTDWLVSVWNKGTTLAYCHYVYT